MNEQDKIKVPFRYRVVRWIQMFGLLIAGSSLFAFLLLYSLDTFAPTGNPYVGILAYLIAPILLIIGLGIMVVGWMLRRRLLALEKGPEAGYYPFWAFDMSQKRDRRAVILSFFSGMLMLVAVGSYQSYHFTESNQFCGRVCHTVMKPEMVTYENSPHARVPCVECHIGPGATWYLRSKLSGMYQLYATLGDKFPRPIPTPIENLRPAQDTCEHCHWPQKFVGNLERTYVHYLSDEDNTPYTVRMSLSVGGGDPKHGPVSGIHWHMNVGNRVEYIATDAKKQVIPWVRVIDQQGVVTEYRTSGFVEDPSHYSIHVMDCMDCHNRPSHIFQSPDEAVNLYTFAPAPGSHDEVYQSQRHESVDAAIRNRERGIAEDCHLPARQVSRRPALVRND